MADIHYVWWGNPPADNADLMGKAADTPNAMVALVGGRHTVHYWRQPGAFNPVLSAQIEVHELSDPSTLLAGTYLEAGNRTRMEAIIATLARYRAYAAVKDLLSYAIMNKHGGYFFDTTTRISGVGTPQIRRMLDAPADGPRVPFYKVQGGGKYMRPDDQSADYTQMFPIGVIPDARTVHVPNFDVWALYSPPQSVLFNTAVSSYLDRAMNFGLNAYPSVARLGSKSVHEVMTQDDKDSRNLIIAGLSTTSILQGLHVEAKTSKKTVADFGWEVIKKDASNAAYLFPDGGAVYVPALGLHKVFGGSWR